MSHALRAFATASRSAAARPSTYSAGAVRSFSYTPFGPNPKSAQLSTDAATTPTTAASESAAEEASAGALSDAQAYVLTQPPSSTYFRNIPLGAYPVAVPYNNEDAQAAASRTAPN